MTRGDRVIYAIVSMVVLTVLVMLLWVVYVVFAGPPLEATAKAASVAMAEPTHSPSPTVSPLLVHATQTPKPVEATPTPVPPTLLPTHTPQPTAAPPTHTPAIQRTLYRVVEALAGDTVLVSMAGRTFIICYAGIDAPDPATVIGCMATQANRRFVKGETVYLQKDALDTDQSGCLLRHVFLEDGTLVSARLVYFGYATVRSDSPNARYRDALLKMQQWAKEAKFGLWGAALAPLSAPLPPPTVTPLPPPTLKPVEATPTSVAPTPTPTPTVSVEAAKVVVDTGCCQFDAPGDDNENKEAEWVCFANVGGQAADMTGWVLHDEENWRYIFPAFSLAPGQMVRVHTGCGANTAMDLYWCKGGATAVWNNEGDTVFLLDAAENVVAKYSY